MKKLLCVAMLACVTMGVQAQADISEVVKQATNAGIKKCLHVVKSLSDVTINNRPHGARCKWASGNPDAGIFSCEVEAWSPTEDKYSMYASLTVAPTLDGKCVGDYTVVNQYIDDCRTVRQRSPKMDLEKKTKNLIYLKQTTGNVSNYLMEQAGHCVLVKHEMVIHESK